MLLKQLGKDVANALALAMMLPLFLAFWTAAIVFGQEKLFPGMSQLISTIPGISGAYLRRAFYRLVFDKCGSDTCICFGSVFSHARTSIGNGVYIGLYCVVGKALLEDDVLVSSHVSIVNGQHQHGIERLDIPVREQEGQYPRITIGEDSWIGERAVVMANVGKHAVVGAGTVVVKPVPDFAIVVGNPARIVHWRGGRSSRSTTISDG